GCFNLVRKNVLEKLGGFEPLRLDLIDDASLGFRIASRGYRSVGYSGRDALHVEWYSGLGDMLRGFEKNAFAGVRFRLSEALLASATTLAFWAGVFVAPWWGRAEVAWFGVGVIAFNTVATIRVSQRLGLEWWPDLFHPIGILGLPVILLRSAFRAVRTGEIRWRDTHYSLATLRDAQSCDLSVLRRIRMGLEKPRVIEDEEVAS
ncbi:MAG: glycosyltransferase, partial [Planctomycetota bacterium]